MTKKLQVYKCEVCGNIVEVLHSGQGQLVCCGEPMVLLKEKTSDEGKEKHVPVVEITESGTRVKVGSVPHPMEEKHYIEWIAVETKNGECRQFVSPGELPEAVFPVNSKAIRSQRCYCNIHGLWVG